MVSEVFHMVVNIPVYNYDNILSFTHNALRMKQQHVD